MVRNFSILLLLTAFLSGCGSDGNNENPEYADSLQASIDDNMEFLQLTPEETGIDFTNTITAEKISL